MSNESFYMSNETYLDKIFDLLEKAQQIANETDLDTILNLLEEARQISNETHLDTILNLLEEAQQITTYAEKLETTERISFVLNLLGVILSTIGLIILLLTFWMFPQWRKKHQNQLFLHFAVALILKSLILLQVEYLNFFALLELPEKPQYDLPITLTIKVYLELVLLLWTFIFTKHLYDSLVKVILVKTDHRLLRQSLIIWLTPLLFSMFLLLSINFVFRIYVFWYSLVIKWPVLLLNIGLYGFIVVSVLKSYNDNNKRNKKKIKTMIVFILLFIIITLQNILADVGVISLKLLDDAENVKELEVIVNVNYVLLGISHFQCFVTIIYWLWGNAEGREMWGSYCRKIPWCRKQNNIDTIAL